MAETAKKLIYSHNEDKEKRCGVLLNAVFSILLLVTAGLLSLCIAHVTRLPRSLVLLLAGLGIQVAQLQSIVQLTLPESLFLPIATACLVYAALDHAVQIKLKEYTAFSHKLVHFTLVRVFVAIILIIVLQYIVHVSFVQALLISLLLVGGAPEIFKHVQKKHHVDMLVHSDAAVSSIISLAGVFLFTTAASVGNLVGAQNAVLGFLLAVGIGIFFGGLFYRVIRMIPAIAARACLFVAGLLGYLLGERFIPGTGIFAPLSLGLFLTNTHIPHELTHGKTTSSVVDLVVFLLLGMYLPLMLDQWLLAAIFVLALVLARLLAIELVLHSFRMSAQEKLMTCLNNPLGLPAAAATLLLIMIAPPLAGILQLIPAVMLLTLVVHSLVTV